MLKKSIKTKGTEFNLLDISKPTADLPSIEDGYGLIIVRLPALKSDVVPTIVDNARSLLSDDGKLVMIQPNASQRQICDKVNRLKTVLKSNGFHKTRHVSKTEQSITLATAESRSSTVQAAPSNQVNIVRFSKSTPVT